MTLTHIGLMLIGFAWLLQFFTKKNMIDMKFVSIYILGVVILITDGLLSGQITLALLNLISFLSAGAVYMKLRK